MKAQIFDSIPNTGILKPVLIRSMNDYIEIKKGRYIHNDYSHPLKTKDVNLYSRVYCLEYNKYIIYWFDSFGHQDSNNGFHVGFNWWQNQHFLFIQNAHWIQKEENIRYIINIIFLILGLVSVFK